jgi:hypothetical protein
MPASSARLARRVPRMVALAASARICASTARHVVLAELDPDAVGGLVDRQFGSALAATMQGAADVGGVSITINMLGSAGIAADGTVTGPPSGVWASAMGGASAQAVANRIIGAPAGGHLPPLRPPTSVLRQLESLPAGWAGLAAAAPAALSAGSLGADISPAVASAWLAQVTGGGGAGPVATAADMERAVYNAVRSAAVVAGTNAVRGFLAGEINPILTSAVSALVTSVNDEVTRVMATPAGALASAAPRDPDIAAVAASEHAQLTTAAVAAQATQMVTPGSTAVDPGATAPAQQVTYGTVNMMSDNQTVFRTDQFVELAHQFNSSGLRRDREGEFHAELA